VWLENGERVVAERDRLPLGVGPDRGRPKFEAAQQIHDPELQARALMKKLDELFPYTRGVCFGCGGKD